MFCLSLPLVAFAVGCHSLAITRVDAFQAQGQSLRWYQPNYGLINDKQAPLWSSIREESQPATISEDSEIVSSQQEDIHHPKISIDLRSYEERGKRELEWLIETTSKILDFDIYNSSQYNSLEATPTTPTTSSENDPVEQKEPRVVGSMSPILTRRAFALMTAWARRSAKPHIVELILKCLIKEFEAGNQHVKITTETYNVVLDAWSKSRDPGAPERAETILNEMFKHHNKKVKPNVKSYNAVMNAYVDSDKWHTKSYPKVQAIFDRLVQASESGKEMPATRELNNDDEDHHPHYKEEVLAPNRMSYNLLLSAIANSALEDTAERSEALLRTMLQEYHNGDDKAKPDIRSYNHVLRAWSCYESDISSRERRHHEAKTLELFDELRSLPESLGVEPNVETFNLVLRLFRKTNHNPKRLENLEAVLRLIEESFEAGNDSAKPDRVTINTVVAAYAKSGKRMDVEHALTLGGAMERKYGVAPDTVSNNIVMAIWSKSGHQDACWKALRILDGMEHDFKNGKLHLKPDAYTYSCVIDGFARVGNEDSAENGQEVLERMRHLHRNHGGDPANASVYNAAINAWASSGTSSGAARAIAILNEMEENYKVDPFVPAPDTTSYNTAIKGLRNGGFRSTERAEELLHQMEVSERSGLNPDAFTFTSLITAYGRSTQEMKAEKAYNVLQRQITAYKNGNLKARPNVLAFNSLLSKLLLLFLRKEYSA